MWIFIFFFPTSEGIRPAARWSCCEVSAGRLGQSPRREPVPALGVGGCRAPGQGTLEAGGGGCHRQGLQCPCDESQACEGFLLTSAYRVLDALVSLSLFPLYFFFFKVISVGLLLSCELLAKLLGSWKELFWA